MSARADAERSRQLGMPYTSAQGKLQRKIIFWLAQRLGLDVCFRCGKKIERLEEFSTEHKTAWLHASPDLFWDLDNIAFSHLTCNLRSARKVNTWLFPRKMASKRRRVRAAKIAAAASWKARRAREQ